MDYCDGSLNSNFMPPIIGKGSPNRYIVHCSMQQSVQQLKFPKLAIDVVGDNMNLRKPVVEQAVFVIFQRTVASDMPTGRSMPAHSKPRFCCVGLNSASP